MKRFEVGLLIAFLMLLIAAFNCSCSNVKKSQSSNSESVSVTKSDSSSVKTFTVIDTTKTDESTTVTEYEITADSIEWAGGTHNVAIGYSALRNTTTGTSSIALGQSAFGRRITELPSGIPKAKGVRIKAKITETKKAEQKGQSLEKKEVQVNTKSDSTKTVQSTSKQVTREPSAKIWIWFFLIVAAIVVIWWKRDWLIGKAVKLFT
jgi:hypothetical protein